VGRANQMEMAEMMKRPDGDDSHAQHPRNRAAKDRLKVRQPADRADVRGALDEISAGGATAKAHDILARESPSAGKS